MSDIKISVIIPVYNLEQYIGKCIESILLQDFKEWEAILVNDGSTDDSLRICEEYSLKDKRIKVINQVNKGVSAARKNGFDISKGKWVTFVDSDDELPSHSLSYMYRECETRNLDIFVGNQYYINSKKKTWQFKKTGMFDNETYCTIVADYQILMGLRGKLIKREILNKCPMNIDRKIVNNEDILITLFLAEHIQRAYITNMPVYGYLLRDGSAAHKTYPISYWEMYFDYYKELSEKYNQKKSIYIRSKITKLCSLTRNYAGKYDFDYSCHRFDDIRNARLTNLGFYRNVLLLVCKTNSKFLIKILRFHPSKLLK